MVSDSELVTRLQAILTESDLNTTTPATVRRQLEADLGVDLSEKKGYIREQIDIFIQTLEREQENDDVVEEDEEEEEEEEEEIENKKRRSCKKEKVKRKGGGGGFCKPCSLSPQLQEFVGVPVMARTEVVKKVWAYIREKNLQDPKNKKNIICDETLNALFCVKTIDMFQMNKALSKHIWPLNVENDKVKEEVKHEQSNESSQEDTGNSEEAEDEGKDEAEDEGKEEAEDEGKEEAEDECKEEAEDEAKEEAEDEEEEKENNEPRSGKKKTVKADKSVKKNRGGFAKVCSLSPQLQSVMGVPEMSRTEVVKRLWAYIRENNLQDPKNRRNIICDESLRGVFRVNTINMFQMNKVLSKHIWPLDEDDGAASSSRKEKPNKRVREESSDDEPEPKAKAKAKEKRQKKGQSGLLAPLPLSDALVEFIGTGETALSRGEVVKKMWEYIKQNDLQDPSDKRRVLCDDKLKELLGVDSFHGFSISKLLTPHFIKNE